MFNHRRDNGKDTGLPQALLKQARASGQLNLSGRSLGVLPSDVWRINLDAGKGQVADLSGNDDAWWNQVELSKLFIASNGLTEIPDDIGLLEALVTLDAHDNRIVVISPRMGTLTELKIVNFGYNSITDFPFEMCGLPNLNVLRLEHNALASLPEAFGNLTSLVELDLSNNTLSHLPETIGNLRHLNKLNLSKNALKDLPASLEQLHELRELDASWNKLAGLPAGMSSLRGLVRIDLRYNMIRQLPDLSHAAELAEIQIGFNRIDTIGDIKGLPPRLSVLDIRDNKVAVLPASISTLYKLERLDLTNNDFSSLPPELGTIETLKSIVLDGNPCRSIRRDIISRGTMAIKEHLKSKLASDPDEVAHKTHVAEQNGRVASELLRTTNSLNFSGKQAEVVPAAYWADAEGADVASVVLSKNRLTAVPMEVTMFSGTLTTLDVAQNRLSELPPVLARLTVLVTLDCRRNQLSSLPSELVACTKLKEVLIAANRFSIMPPVLYRLSALTAIIASDNQLTEIDVDNLASLEHIACLDLSNNNIGKVPPELGFIETIKKLELHGNPFKMPRPATLAKGTPAVMEYLRGRFA